MTFPKFYFGNLNNVLSFSLSSMVQCFTSSLSRFVKIETSFNHCKEVCLAMRERMILYRLLIIPLFNKLAISFSWPSVILLMMHCVCSVLKHQVEAHMPEYKVPYGTFLLKKTNYSFRCENQKGFEKGQGLYFIVKMCKVKKNLLLATSY